MTTVTQASSPAFSISPGLAATADLSAGTVPVTASAEARETALARSPGEATLELEELVSELNQTLRRFGVEFEIDSAIDRVITRVVDRQSGEQIRQIPTEEVVRILHRLAGQPAAAEAGLLFSELV
ncbi:flagellar protein FlaG [Kushneria sinocarnis]|uniref:Flagellar protein FlaG n=1 Tax=Kushneria sinocarnis TaxID=595502 RepID=A0A420WY41_9GAMM|nr:flagellar protein FlaG [Kushneria sinocarnis]RKR06106.1 flagellar protein FlaG [Kushneria sinocarnis]